MYRPQFAFPPSPALCKDQNCMYSFDATNTPYLVSIAANDPGTNPIPLTLDQDADFLIRAIDIQQTLCRVVLEDCFLHVLVDQNPNNQCLDPRYWCDTEGAGFVALETDNWGIWCPAGGILLAYVQNPTNAPVTGVAINLVGLKRFSGARCIA